MNEHHQHLVDQGLARWHNGRLIPVMRGASGEDEPVEGLFPGFDVAEDGTPDFSALETADVEAFIEDSLAAIDEVAADATAFVTDERDSAQLRAEMVTAVEAVKAARAMLASRAAVEEPETGTEGEGGEGGEGEGGEGEGEPEAEASLSDLAAEAREEPVVETPVVEAPAEGAAVTAAAATTTPARRSRPARARSAAPAEQEAPVVSMTAAAGVTDLPRGQVFPNEFEIAEAMIRRRKSFGIIAEGAEDKVPIARADWSDLYPPERHLLNDDVANDSIIASVIDQGAIRAELERRLKNDLVASGGLCAPVTPYYNLQMISGAFRPVRAALPAFNADRGGLRYAQPASLASITTGVGVMTAAQDQAGGTAGTKTCQTVDCPPFIETDVEVIYHCLKFGNLGARTFPERVAQWNNLVLARHARTAEELLLTGIDAFSTQVTANTLGIGASADLLSQVLTAAAGMRSRHRMDPAAVLRVLFPQWVLDLLVSDVYRSQFQRFDMGAADFIRLLRAGGVEPSFYADSASGKGQEFGVQHAGALLPFPPTTTWYLYPEGSFLYVDGGTLELGLVRDSVLNSTNDFEIFGESFENVAFVGVESLAITSTLCDSGAVSAPHVVTGCGNYLSPS